MRKAQYEEALALAASFYEGKAKAVVGLSGTPDKRKAIVAQKVSRNINGSEPPHTWFIQCSVV